MRTRCYITLGFASSPEISVTLRGETLALAKSHLAKAEMLERVNSSDFSSRAHRLMLMELD